MKETGSSKRLVEKCIAILTIIFGNYSIFIIQFFRTTAVFLIVLSCIFVVRRTVPVLFPPGDFLAKFLHLVDLYVALLGTVGYVIWITLDMYFMTRERLSTYRKDKGGNHERNVKTD